MTKPKTRRTVNYASKSTPKTLKLQAEALRWARAADDGWTVTEMATILGISRQLCLYHIKKMVATGQLVMVLEPCEGNGGLQYRIWDRTQLVCNFVPAMAMQVAA